MSFDPSVVKRLALAGAAVVALTLAVNAGYGLAVLQWRGASPPDMLREMGAGAPYLVLGLFLATVGAVLGARLAAGTSSRWAGPAVGAGLALAAVAVSWVQGRLGFWLPPNAVMAVVGGGLGGWVASAARQRETSNVIRDS